MKKAKNSTTIIGYSKAAQPKIITAIPCFNTEVSIVKVVCEAQKHGDEVIVVDDGSHDNTAKVAREAGARVISHSRNRGYGEAVKSCIEVAKESDADILVILDGDGQHDPDEIGRLVSPILRGEADMVIGSRFLNDVVSMPRYRWFGITVITWLFNLGSSTKVSDAQSGFRAYRKGVFQNFSLAERRMGISIEILEKARREGAIIKEIPISCTYVDSVLSLGAIMHGLSVALSVVRIRLKNSLFENGRER